uniref:phage tail protein n=1 Tax=Roseivirga sp. TaxID=1964215 RepID=UPI004048E384
MTDYNPPVSFYFSLSIDGFTENAALFEEVSGISNEPNILEVSQGGEHQFTNGVPTSVKPSNLILKRGILNSNSELIKWCQQAVSGLATHMQTRNLNLSLMNEKGELTMSWTFVDAYPSKLSVSELNVMDNSIIVETLEFFYNYFNQIK